jgi:hypothetical protein
VSQFSVKGDKLSKLRCKYMYIISKKNMDVHDLERRETNVAVKSIAQLQARS